MQREPSEFEKLSIWKNFDVDKAAQHARAHHAEIMTIMKRIAGHNEESICSRVVDVRNLMTDMVGRLMLHLFMDENVVFKCREIDSEQITAARAGLERLKSRVKDYMAKFASPSDISSAPGKFMEETTSIQRLIEDTFTAEEHGVYAALEK